MKLSEIINAIANNKVIDDRQNPENVDVFIMIQDATDLKHVQVMGYIKGDDDRLAKMVADRMVKSNDFRLMISGACYYYVHYKSREAKKAEKDNSEEKSD
jgi:hypothetical protein